MLKSTATRLAEKRPGEETGVLNTEGLLKNKLPKPETLKYEKWLAVRQIA